MNSMQIAGRWIGAGHPCYVVAEISANHNQRIENALRLVEEAKRAGADAVKIQTYTADTLTLDSNRPEFRIDAGSLWDGRTLHGLYQEAYMPWEWTAQLQAAADSLGIHFFSTPFDDSAVDYLERHNVPAYKIASFELVDIPLIERVASTGKPMILSTGMASLGEIELAVGAARKAGAGGIALLKCTSAYPAPPEEINLRTIGHLSYAFGVPTGLSDHTMGWVVPVAAVAAGASIIEKHFTLSRSDGGPDSAFSLEPDELKAMVDAIRMAERAMGSVHYGVTEKDSRSRVFRRSLFVTRDIKKGEVFTRDNIRSVRPSHGLAPKHLPMVLGKRAAVDLEFGMPLEFRHLGDG